MNRQYLGLLLIVPMLTVSIASTFTVNPSANALIQRDFSYLNDNHLTVFTGNTKVCGDHMCAPGEWDKLQQALAAAQLGSQVGKNATQNSHASSTTTMPNTTTPTVPTSACESIKNILKGVGVSSDTVAKVMADLGCS